MHYNIVIYCGDHYAGCISSMDIYSIPTHIYPRSVTGASLFRATKTAHQ